MDHFEPIDISPAMKEVIKVLSSEQATSKHEVMTLCVDKCGD